MIKSSKPVSTLLCSYYHAYLYLILAFANNFQILCDYKPGYLYFAPILSEKPIWPNIYLVVKWFIVN